MSIEPDDRILLVLWSEVLAYSFFPIFPAAMIKGRSAGLQSSVLLPSLVYFSSQVHPWTHTGSDMWTVSLSTSADGDVMGSETRFTRHANSQLPFLGACWMLSPWPLVMLRPWPHVKTWSTAVQGFHHISSTNKLNFYPYDANRTSSLLSSLHFMASYSMRALDWKQFRAHNAVKLWRSQGLIRQLMVVSPIRETLTAPWGTVNGVALDNNSC